MTKKRPFGMRTSNMKKVREPEKSGPKIYDLPEDVLVWMMKFLSPFELRVLGRTHPKFTRVVSLKRFFLVRNLAGLEKAYRFNVEKAAYRNLEGFSPKPSRFAFFQGCGNVFAGTEFWEEVKFLEIDSPVIFSSVGAGRPNLRLLTIASPSRSTLVLGASFEKLLDGKVKEISILAKGIVFFPVSALKKMADAGTAIFSFQAESGFFYSPNPASHGGMCLHPLSSLDFGTVTFFSSGVRDHLFFDTFV